MDTEEEYRRLAVASAYAFYDEIPTKPRVAPGVAPVVIDALARRQWVREDKLAECLKLQFKQLQRTLRFLEAEKLVIRERKIKEKEYKPKLTVKLRSPTCGGCFNCAEGAKLYSVALSAGQEKKFHPHFRQDKKIEYSYCCLDYAQIYDVVTYRLHLMEKDSNLLGKIKAQLKPLKRQLRLVKDSEAPYFGTLAEWKLGKGSNSSSTEWKYPILFPSRATSKENARSMSILHQRRMAIEAEERRVLEETDQNSKMEQITPSMPLNKTLPSCGLAPSEETDQSLKMQQITPSMPLNEETDQSSKIEQIIASMTLNERLASYALGPSILPSWSVLEERVQKSKMEEGNSAAPMDLNGSKVKKDDDEPKPSSPSTSRIGEGLDSEREGETSIEPEINKVVALLCQSGMYLTAEHIKDACGVDVKGNNNKDLFKGLLNHPRILYVEGLFHFQSKHHAKNQKGLVRALLRYPDGIPVADLKYEYPNAMEDLQTLKASGDIWLLRNADVDLDVAYQRAPLARVDDELKTSFRSADLPTDLPKVLEENGLKPKSAKRIKMIG